MRKKKEITPLNRSDAQFFHNFFEEHHNYLYRTASSYTSNAAERDDLVQETIMRLMKNISVLRQLTCCKTAHYIVITIRTAYIDMLRSNRHISPAPLNDDNDLINALPGELPADGMEKDLHLRMAVKRLKEGLSEREWMALEGKVIMGYTHEELGALLDMNPASVRMVLSRAKARAREILRGENWIGDDSIEG